MIEQIYLPDPPKSTRDSQSPILLPNPTPNPGSPEVWEWYGSCLWSSGGVWHSSGGCTVQDNETLDTLDLLDLEENDENDTRDEINVNSNESPRKQGFMRENLGLTNNQNLKLTAKAFRG